mgnify:CR=1 FL=1
MHDLYFYQANNHIHLFLYTKKKQKKAKMLRFIGFVCWFLALFMLFDEHQRRKELEAEEAKQNAIVMEAEEQEQTGELETTVLFPTE